MQNKKSFYEQFMLSNAKQNTSDISSLNCKALDINSNVQFFVVGFDFQNLQKKTYFGWIRSKHFKVRYDKTTTWRMRLPHNSSRVGWTEEGTMYAREVSKMRFFAICGSDISECKIRRFAGQFPECDGSVQGFIGALGRGGIANELCANRVRQTSTLDISVAKDNKSWR